MKYSVYGKKRVDLDKRPTFYSELLKAEITEDLLQKATSTIECVGDATYLAEGDVISILNDKGVIVYNGVVASVNGSKITTDQMQHIFAGKFYAMSDTSAEKTFWSTYSSMKMFTRYIDHVKAGYMTSRARISSNAEYLDVIPIDSFVYNLNKFITWTGTFPSTKDIPWRTDNEVLDFEQFIYDTYSTYNLITRFDFILEEYTQIQNPYVKQSICYIFDPQKGCYDTNPTTGDITDYFIEPYQKIDLSDNVEFINNINVVQEVEDANTLYIFAANGTTYRDAYTVLQDGTYHQLTLPTSDRYFPVKQKFVNSGETIANIVNAELKNIQYNHKVNFTFDLHNNFYKKDDFKLGQQIDFYVGNKRYNSLLTGWKYSIEGNQEIASIDMTCGKVRNNLTSKLNLGKVK